MRASVLLLLVGCSMMPPPLPVTLETIRDAEGRRDPKSDVLIRALDEPEFAARAAIAMGRIQSLAYVDALIAHASTESTWALGQMGLGLDWRPGDEARILPELLKRGAIEAIGKIGGVVPPSVFKDPSPLVRVAAIDATWRAAYLHKTKVEIAAIVPLAGDPDEDVRWHAAYALMRSKIGHPVLRTLARDSNRWARLFAVRALHDGTGLDDPEALVRVEAVRGAATVPDALVRDPSVMVRRMVAMKRPDAMLDDVSPAVRAEAVAHLKDPSPHLKHLDWRMRAAAASALRDVEKLRPALEDPERRVVLRAIESLGEMNDDASLAKLEQFAECGDVALEWTAIEALGKRRQGLETLMRRAMGPVTLATEPLIDALKALDAKASLDKLTRLPGIVYRSLARKAAGMGPDPEPRGYPRSRFMHRPLAGKFTVDVVHEKGTMRLLLDADAAPENVANIVALVRRGYYDGLDWHRVEPNFVIQGGDPRFDGWGDPGYRELDEISTLPHLRGTIGISKMAKDTGDSQLYITHTPTPHLDGRYTVVGYVIEGLDVLDRIEIGDRILSARVVE